MKAHLIDTHLLEPRSRSSAKVKVKYQGHVPQNMGVWGVLVFLKQFVCVCVWGGGGGGGEEYSGTSLSFHLSMYPSVYKIPAILCHKLLLQLCCYCIENLLIH